jgi:hypothetical protein
LRSNPTPHIRTVQLVQVGHLAELEIKDYEVTGFQRALEGIADDELGLSGPVCPHLSLALAAPQDLRSSINRHPQFHLSFESQRIVRPDPTVAVADIEVDG